MLISTILDKIIEVQFFRHVSNTDNSVKWSILCSRKAEKSLLLCTRSQKTQLSFSYQVVKIRLIANEFSTVRILTTCFDWVLLLFFAYVIFIGFLFFSNDLNTLSKKN